MADDKREKRPLRTSSNASKDLFDTYLKNEGESPERRSTEPVDAPADSKGEEIIEKEELMQEAAKEAAVKEIPTSEEKEERIEEIKDTDNSEPNDDEKIILELYDKNEALEEELKDTKEKLLRKSAEMENLRKRTAKEKSELVDYANERLLYNFLDILDNLEQALDAAKTSGGDDAVLAGVEMIAQKTRKLFEDAGVKPMENPEGREFDVDFHEAMMTMPSDKPEGTVVKEMQKGYMIRDKVLRHAKVATSSGEGNDKSFRD